MICAAIKKKTYDRRIAVLHVTAHSKASDWGTFRLKAFSRACRAFHRTNRVYLIFVSIGTIIHASFIVTMSCNLAFSISLIERKAIDRIICVLNTPAEEGGISNTAREFTKVP